MTDNGNVLCPTADPVDGVQPMSDDSAVRQGAAIEQGDGVNRPGACAFGQRVSFLVVCAQTLTGRLLTKVDHLTTTRYSPEDALRNAEAVERLAGELQTVAAQIARHAVGERR
jgi:hypothetical protein